MKSGILAALIAALAGCGAPGIQARDVSHDILTLPARRMPSGRVVAVGPIVIVEARYAGDGAGTAKLWVSDDGACALDRAQPFAELRRDERWSGELYLGKAEAVCVEHTGQRGEAALLWAAAPR